MGRKSETTIAGVLLHKHAGDGRLSDRRWHFYRGTIEGVGVSFRPRLGADARPIEWYAYARISRGALRHLESVIGSGATLTAAVQRAAYNLGERAKRMRPREQRS